MPKHSSPGHASKYTPQPQNWQGVESGMAEATHLFQAGELSRAEDVMQQVLEFAPMEGQVWHLLGRILQRAGRHAEALECFTSAETCYGRRKPDQGPPASIRLARLLWNQGECRQARVMLDTLLLRHPNDTSLHQLCETWRLRDGATT